MASQGPGPGPTEADGGDDERSRLRARAQERLHVVTGLLRAIEFGWPLIEAVEECDDRRSASERLTAPPFGFDAYQAAHVVDLTVGQRTRGAREALEGERAELERLLRDEL